MAPSGKRFVTYYRVSTQKQGASGLGLEAQRAAVAAFLAAHGGRTVAELTEVESGKLNARPQLEAALLRCRQTRATLLVAKLDRLSRNVAFLMGLRDSGVRFVCADMPDMNETVVGIMAVVAQGEREAISARTKAALQAAKARGVRLGNPRLQPGTAEGAAKARQAQAERAKRFAEDLRPAVEAAQASGATTLRALAARLTSLEALTPRGHTWTPMAVRRLLARLELRAA